MCQLNLANKIQKLLLPTSDPEDESKEVDLDDHDLGLTFEKVRAHQYLVQDLGEDLEYNRDESQNDLANLKFVPNFIPKKDKEQRSTIESEDCKDNGEWLLEQLDLTGLDEWSKDLRKPRTCSEEMLLFLVRMI